MHIYRELVTIDLFCLLIFTLSVTEIPLRIATYLEEAQCVDMGSSVQECIHNTRIDKVNSWGTTNGYLATIDVFQMLSVHVRAIFAW